MVGGVQQIKAHIDFHTYSELVLWPYGYTTADTAPGLTADDRNAHATLGQQMAATNGYTPEQASDLYIADGTIDDWLWGQHKIFTLHVRDVPEDLEPRLLPAGRGDRPTQTSRNREAVLMLEEAADCVYKVIGLTCGGPAPTTVFFDDFETDDADGRATSRARDTATTGLWERGDPATDDQQRRQAARHDGQRASTTSSPARRRGRRPAPTTSTAASRRSPRRRSR